MLPFSAPSPPSQASELTEVWNRISRQHMTAGSGCGCGFGGLILQASDFELDIVEFVLDEAKATGRKAVAPFVEAVAKRGSESFSIKALLSALERQDSRISDDDRSFVLTRLETTLSSIDTAHGKGGFACD